MRNVFRDSANGRHSGQHRRANRTSSDAGAVANCGHCGEKEKGCIMNQTVAWIGAYFFGFLAFLAIALDLLKKEPRKALVLIGTGSFFLFGICEVSASGRIGMSSYTFYAITICGCLLFFWGLAQWRAHHLKRKDKGPKQ